MKTLTNQPMTKLIAVTKRNTAVFKTGEGVIEESELQTDTLGVIYFLNENGKICYLPTNYQPRLVFKN